MAEKLDFTRVFCGKAEKQRGRFTGISGFESEEPALKTDVRFKKHARGSWLGIGRPCLGLSDRREKESVKDG